MSKCSHCGHDVDAIRFKTCSRCREKFRITMRLWREKQKKDNLCVLCGKTNVSDAFSRCAPCREKFRILYDERKKKRKAATRKTPTRPTNDNVQIKVEYTRLLEEKAEERGETKQVIFAELIDKYLGMVQVWWLWGTMGNHAHYNPCTNCQNAHDSTNGMFYCSEMKIKIPNEEFIHNCVYYTRRTDTELT